MNVTQDGRRAPSTASPASPSGGSGAVPVGEPEGAGRPTDPQIIAALKPFMLGTTSAEVNAWARATVSALDANGWQIVRKP